MPLFELKIKSESSKFESFQPKAKAKKNKKSAGDSLAASDPFAHLFKKKDSSSLTWPQKVSETNGSSSTSMADYKKVGALSCLVQTLKSGDVFEKEI